MMRRDMDISRAASLFLVDVGVLPDVAVSGHITEAGSRG